LKQKSAAKPSEAKPSEAKPSESAVHGKRAEQSKPMKVTRAARMLTRVAHKPRERTVVMFCTHFRSYSPASGTYLGYDGRTHSCR